MELVKGITKVEHTEYALYYIESLSDEFKNEIRERLVSICHGADKAHSPRLIYSYKETVKEFLRRYKDDETRNKGLIGELLIHTIIGVEGKFVAASPFFNMEERSFKKGFDITLYEPGNSELWIAEVKSGHKQAAQKNASSAIVNLINTAKKDLNERLNDKDTHLWLNALHSAETAMQANSPQKNVIINLLEQCADKAVIGTGKSTDFNVILSASLFHTMTDKMGEQEVEKKYRKIVDEGIFNRIIVIAVQKNTFEAVYEFLKSEVENKDD